MSPWEIRKCDQGPSLGLADSRDFTAVPWYPVCPLSKNLSDDPGGPCSNPLPASTSCVALGQSINLSELLFSHLQKEFHNMYLTKWPWEFLFDLKYTEGKRLEAIVSGCSVQSLSHVWLFVTPWTAARQASLSITTSQTLLKLMSIKSVMPSNHLILCHPLLLPPSILQASGSFPISQFFTSGGQSIEVSASASVLPMNIQDWFPFHFSSGW